MTWPVRLAAVLVTVAGASGLVTWSARPMRLAQSSASHAVLQLDWRVRAEEAGDCLRPRPEDLASLPAHMRNPDACLGGLPPYRLQLWIDETLMIDDVIRGGGAREDRPLTVYREVPVAAGGHRIRATFVRETPSQDGRPETREPANLRVDTTATLQARRVLLVVRRQDTGALEVRPPVP